MVIGRHAFKGYDDALQEMMTGLGTMSEQVDALLVMLENALSNQLDDLSEVRATDKQVNKQEYKIIDQLHFILQRYTPSFQELWFLTSLNKVAASLEKVGDQAKGTIRALDKLPEGFSEKHRSDMHEILELTRAMMKEALENLRDYHPESAADIVKTEQIVNERSSDLRYSLLQAATASASELQQEHRMLTIVRDIERLADHSIDILRMAFFVHTGERFKRKLSLKALEE